MKTLHCRLEADYWYGHSSAVSQTGELFSEYVQLFAYPSEFKFQLIFTNLFGTMSFMQHNELENRRCHTVIGVTVFVRATFRSSETDHNVTYKRSTINNNNAAFFFHLGIPSSAFQVRTINAIKVSWNVWLSWKISYFHFLFVSSLQWEATHWVSWTSWFYSIDYHRDEQLKMRISIIIQQQISLYVYWKDL